MGFYEDERIRSKNKIHNEAHETYKKLKMMGMSDRDIVKYIQHISASEQDSYRNDLYMLIKQLARDDSYADVKQVNC